MSQNRISKTNYYLDIAKVVASRGTCLRRNYGAVIVKNDIIISTGYTGAARKDINCIDSGKCLREELKIPSGQRYEICKSVHAEMNACLQAKGIDLIDSTLYLVGIDYKTREILPDVMPCLLCQRVIINARIRNVIVRETKENFKIINPYSWI